MAVDMYLRIEGIKGEAKDSKHADEIQVTSWTWEASQTGTAGQGTGSGAGKVEHQDIEIRKLVDRSSPTLYKACCKGDHIKSADLTVCKAGGDALEYLIIHLEDLIITSFKMGGEPKADQIEEILRINFSRAAIHYTPQDTGGIGGAKVSGGWDLQTNKPFDG